MAGCMRYCCASSNALTPERCSRSKRLWPRAAADGDAESTVGGSCWGSPTRTMAAPGRSTCGVVKCGEKRGEGQVSEPQLMRAVH
eukprot:363344-Chlamydomonas_euryale.AAC.3